MSQYLHPSIVPLISNNDLREIMGMPAEHVMSYYNKVEPEFVAWMTANSRAIAENLVNTLKKQYNLQDQQLHGVVDNVANEINVNNLRVATLINQQRNTIDRKLLDMPDFLIQLGENPDLLTEYESGNLSTSAYPRGETDPAIKNKHMAKRALAKNKLNGLPGAIDPNKHETEE